MLTSDEAIAVGVKQYRSLYPKGTVPQEIEEHGVLGATPDNKVVAVHVTFWFQGEPNPFYLFRATVDRTTGDVCVDAAEDWRLLLNREFDSSQHL